MGEHAGGEAIGRLEVSELDEAASLDFWRVVRDAAPLAAGAGAVWRVSLPPAAAPGFVAALAEKGEAEHYFDWGGGLVWLALPATADCGAVAIRAALAGSGGHATLLRAPAALRAAIPVFEPQPPVLAALTARIKDAFDPCRILNPGRMAEGL